MKYLLFLIFVFFIQAGESQNIKFVNETVAIIGEAQNAKAGAIIISKEDKVYYMDGIDYWDKKILGKKIEVKGKLKIETFEKDAIISENDEVSQGMIGEKMTILSPKWTIK